MRNQLLRMMPFMLFALLLVGAVQPAFAQQQVEVSVLLDPGTLGLEYAAWLEEEWFPAFEAENPHITISPTRLVGNRLDTVALAVAGGVVWDIVPAAHTLPMIEGVGQQWYLPLNDFMDQWEDAQYMIPTALEHTIWQGEILALPHSIPPRFISYNKFLFAESGLDPESPPTTWDELISAARRLTVTRDDTLVRRGYNMPATSNGDIAIYFEQFGKSAGGRMLSDDYRAPRFGEPWGLDTVEFMKNLYNAGNPTGYESTLGTSANASIYNREAAMAPSVGGAVPTNVAANYSEQVDLGMFLPRRDANHEPVATASINSMAIMRFTQHPEEAWQVLASMYSAEALMQFTLMRGQVVPRTDLFADVAREMPEIMPLFDFLNNLIPRPKWPTGGGYTYTSGLGAPVRQAVLGDIAPEMAIDEAVRLVNIILDEFWK